MPLPLLPPHSTFLVLSLIMITRYFLTSKLLTWYCRGKNLTPINSGPVSPQQQRRDVYYSVLSSLVFAAIGTLMITLWRQGLTKIYHDPIYPLWYLPVSFFLYAFLHDTYFYWTHRYFHRRGIMKLHRAHHESKIPTAWTSFAFHPLEALIQALALPLLICLIPIHWMVFALLLLMMTITGVLNHLGYELYPAVLERKFYLISATHHQQHHSRSTANFGLYFTLWDKWMGTEGKPNG